MKKGLCKLHPMKAARLVKQFENRLAMGGNWDSIKAYFYAHWSDFADLIPGTWTDKKKELEKLILE